MSTVGVQEPMVGQIEGPTIISCRIRHRSGKTKGGTKKTGKYMRELHGLLVSKTR